jgi:hypothetical protein
MSTLLDNNEVIASLRPASGGTAAYDNFRCETCKSDFQLTNALSEAELRIRSRAMKCGRCGAGCAVLDAPDYSARP